MALKPRKIIKFKQSLSGKPLSKKALDEYKDILNNVVGKYNKNTMEALYK